MVKTVEVSKAKFHLFLFLSLISIFIAVSAAEFEYVLKNLGTLTFLFHFCVT